jgi:hypothetical protein
MDLLSALRDRVKAKAGELVPQKDGSLKMEKVVAERKSFLSKKKLTYTCRLRVDEAARQVRFFEMLKESGFGVSAGGGDDTSPGFGFKKETYGISAKGRSGSIEEQSRLFGKDYAYRFDFGAFREALREEAEGAGYAFEIKLMEKAV